MLTRDTHRDDAIRLDKHVVYRSRHCARADAIRVRRRPRDLDRVHVREARNKRDDREVHPLRRLLVERVERDQQRECPELEENGGDCARVDDLAHVARCEEHDHPDHLGGDAEQVRLRCGVAKVSQRESEVELGRGDWDWKRRKGLCWADATSAKQAYGSG